MIDPTKISVFVAVPAYGYSVNDHTALSLFRLGQRLAGLGVTAGIAMLSFPDIVETRNAYISIWYYNYPQYTHLLFVDSDMDFPPDLVQDMFAYDKPLVGVVYRRKCDNVDWVVTTVDGPYGVENGFIPVVAIGMGVTLIRRDCIDRMVEAYPELIHDVPKDAPPLEMFSGQQLTKVFRCFDKFPMGYANLSEDFSFCKRWKELGGVIYANIAHKVGHAGPKMFSGSLLKQIRSEIQEAAE